MVSLLLTFNKYTASEVYLFHYIIFMIQYKIIWSEHKCVSEHEKKQVKNGCWKEFHKRKTNFIGKYTTYSDLCIKNLGLDIQDLGIKDLD